MNIISTLGTTPCLQDAFSLEVDLNGDAEVLIDPILDGIGMENKPHNLWKTNLTISIEALPRLSCDERHCEDGEETCPPVSE